MVRWPSRYAANAGVGAIGAARRVDEAAQADDDAVAVGEVDRGMDQEQRRLARIRVRRRARPRTDDACPVVASSSTIGESAVERAASASASPGSFDARRVEPGICTMISEPGLQPSARFWSVTSMCTPALLAGSDAATSASRRFGRRRRVRDGEVVVREAGACTRAPIGSQRCLGRGVDAEGRRRDRRRRRLRERRGPGRGSRVLRCGAAPRGEEHAAERGHRASRPCRHRSPSRTRAPVERTSAERCRLVALRVGHAAPAGSADRGGAGGESGDSEDDERHRGQAGEGQAAAAIARRRRPLGPSSPGLTPTRPRP